MSSRRRRIFAGDRIRDLRRDQDLSQAALATRLGISVSYLSQIENGDRPLTSLVLHALGREFPLQWSDDAAQDDMSALVGAVDAAADTSVPDGRMDAPAARRAVEQQPMMARRLVAVHAAFRRSQEQLRVLDDKVESGARDGGQLPWEEVRDWYQAAGNYLDPLDRAAEALAAALPPGAIPARRIEARMHDAYGVSVAAQASDVARLSQYDPASNTLSINAALPPESQSFLLAHHLVRHELADAMSDVITHSGLSSPASRELLQVGLANYAAGALLMPYAAFRASARAVRHDIDRLRQMFAVSFEQACHRLSTLQRPGATGIPFFFCRVDMAGNITKRHSATRLQFARFGGACPLWVVHEAVAIPDRILVQLAEMPDGVRYVSMAKGLVKPTGSFARTPRRYAVALGCEEVHAPDFVYADAIRTGGVATPIGTSCRICPRPDCDQRAFPPAASIIEFDTDTRSTVPYRFR